jgi:zinc/manganese transport system substrate-binding protein
MILIMRLGLLLLAGVLSACSAGAGTETGLQVVATTEIIGDVAAGILGDAGEVEVLMPPGTDPHEFQPSASQIALLREADLVLANGLGLEEGMGDALLQAEADGAKVLTLAPLVDPLRLPEGGWDPHFWLDPVRMTKAVEAIAGELASLEATTDWMTPAQEAAQAILAAHEEAEALLAPIEQRKLVTNHQALGYFADRYDFEVVGVLVPGGSTLAQPNPADLADLVETMRREHMTVIFAETTEPTALAAAVAAEMAEPVKVVQLYTEALGEPGSEAANYTGMIKANARLVAEALG